MPNHRPCRRRLPRLFVAIAGLLFLVGTAAEPLVHALIAGAGSASTAAVVQAGDGDGPEQPHDESDCLLCKASGPVVLTLGGALIALVVHAGGQERVGEADGRAPPAFPAVQPRAPPHA